MRRVARYEVEIVGVSLAADDGGACMRIKSVKVTKNRIYILDVGPKVAEGCGWMSRSIQTATVVVRLSGFLDVEEGEEVRVI